MTTYESATQTSAESGPMTRTPGTSAGVLLFLLGVWGAVVPFIGSYFSFGYTPEHSWTSARVWLEVLPGSAVAVGGLVLIWSSRTYFAAVAGTWLGILGGAWFVVGPQLAVLLHTGSVGQPTGQSEGRRALESLAYFYGLGALMILLAALVAGRVSLHRALVRSVDAYPADGSAGAQPAARPAMREEQRRHAHEYFAGQERGESQGRSGIMAPSSPSDTPYPTAPIDVDTPWRASTPQDSP